MQGHSGFLKTSSAVVKTAAWIFLFLGIVGGVSIFLGMAPGNPRWMGIIILAIYGFGFFLLFLIAKMAGLLAELVKEIKKE
jgi:ABC-type multidrug transport system permease subunit